MGAFENSATAGSNTSINGIAAAGSSSLANADDTFRELAAQLKQYSLDMAGANTVGGSADAITITLASGTVSAIYDGLMVAGIAASDNATTTPTINIASTGAKVIKKAVLGAETALAAGDIRSGGLYAFRYRSAWASGGGAYQLIDMNVPVMELSSDTTPQLGGTLDANSKQIRMAKGADVASATSLTLGTDGNYFNITGTTTITSIGALAVGTTVILRFNAALTLTHHSTDLILPGAANITTAAGDHAIMVEYASGDWRCTHYQKADGTAVVVASSSTLPVGAVMPYAGTSAPSGWLFAYGQAVSRTTYSALFTAISTTYGNGDGSTTFNLPDLRGRVVAGQDDMGGSSANRLTGLSGGVDGDTLAATGGAESVTLNYNNVPYNGGAGISSYYVPQSSNQRTDAAAHNNVQPTIILNYIIFANA